ncbi:MAG: DNA topoisomerase 3 [Bacteroidia bacterium]|nr:DNA topoisomerase 3 [Bacteroidia bacterium]
MIVVLAEKPSVARELARILGADERKQGWLEGNGYQVTWAVGHLIGLADTKDYGFPFWDLDNLPIIPRTFLTKVTGDEGLQRQYLVIKKLFEGAEEIVNATDAGREGELIFRYIYLHSHCEKPFKRLWISSQTDKAIKDGFAKLKPGAEYDNLFEAARCRAEADWLVGINATQAYTLKYGNKPPFGEFGKRREGPISLGRVQTPVLRLLVERWEEVEAFTPETYWELILTLEKEGQTFQAKWFTDEKDRFHEEAEGRAIMDKLGETVLVESADRKPKSERPPQLYDLTELQKDANKRYNFSAQQTLDLAQDLYEKFKVITYPRTDSRYLSDDLYPGMPDLLRNVGKVSAYAPFVEKALALGLEKDIRFFNDKKVSDHHAIIPTETDPTTVSLPKDHYRLYDLIVRRLLSAFLGNCEKELSEIILTEAGERFKAKGTMIKTNGWRDIYQALERGLAKQKQEAGRAKKKTTESEEELELPWVDVGEVLPVKEKDLPKKRTKAPSIHTESSILGLMETAGKDFEDEELREAMKDKGLGTPATRAGMIETLIRRDYIVRDKKKLIPTDKGVGLINLVRTRPISEPALTGEWESRLHKIARGDYQPDQFLQEVRQFTVQVTNDAKGIQPPPKIMPDYTMEEVTCPKCGEGKLLKGKRAFGCSRYKEGCDFTLQPYIAGKLVEKEHLLDLLQNKLTSAFVQGFTNRKGNRFDARLTLGEDWKVGFFFGKE